MTPAPGRTSPHLAAGDFYRADHRAIDAALSAMFEENSTVDAVLVAEQLDRDGQLEAAGGLPYPVELAANGAAYAARVRDTYDARGAP